MANFLLAVPPLRIGRRRRRCGTEQLCGDPLRESSHELAALHVGVGASAAGMASLFYAGITVGRALGGFLTMRFDDPTMIRIGQCVLLMLVMRSLLAAIAQHDELEAVI